MNAYGSANPGWTRIKRCLYLVMGLLMLAQILLGETWIAKNYDTVPGFGDTGEYISLSRSFELDEYRPVLYPLLLRISREISESSFYHIIFVFQVGLSLFAMCYAVYTLDLVCGRRGPGGWTPYNRLLWLFGGMYLTSIPMITFMNMTILTDSIANSLLVLFLSIAIQIIYAGRLSVKRGVALAVCLIGQCLIRADRLYSGLLLLVILGFMALRFTPPHPKKRYILLGTACVAAVTIAVVGLVGSATQVRGRNGRVQTNFSFILLDRVVFPHMTENYEYFPQEIRDNITLEEAQVFDSHNNNVMYQMAPLLEERVGVEKANEYYRTMAGIVWEHSSGAIIHDIGETVLMVLVTPLMSYLALKGLYRKTNIGWNMHCLSSTTPELTPQYSKAAFLILAATLAIALIIWIGNRVARGRRKRPFILWPYVIESVLLCLWFTLGDGATANDRYMLIIYVTYALLPLLLFFEDTAQRDLTSGGTPSPEDTEDKGETT